ncbi:MAG TPA: T9SS type A sorting domain-containing protein [bacterium]|nr:T9SS type A sorting domain-containing protein [bacterium]
MKTAAAAILVLLLVVNAQAYEHWNNERHSALLPDESIAIRVESPSGQNLENYLLFSGDGIEERPMVAIPDGPSTVTATMPGPISDSRRCGFRLIRNGELDLMPVRLADGAAPVPSDLTLLESDPVGDELYGYQNLDLVASHVGLSEARLYGALTNAGGGFPTSQMLTFFGYVLAIADPALAAPDTVFLLMHTLNQPGIITPGLYKATGPETGDLVWLGDVVTEEYPATNQLVISCALADLVADPYFASWYDTSDPAIGLAALTQRITLLGGVDQADESPGGTCWLRGCSIEPFVNQLPTLSDLTFEGTGPGAFARVDYSDANGHCPVVCEVSFDGGEPVAMLPQTLDYGAPVTYATEAGIEPLASGVWTTAVARFSDNASDFIELAATNTGVDEDGHRPVQGLALSIERNPTSTSAIIEFAMPAQGHLRVDVFDVSGRVLRTLVDRVVGTEAGTLSWDGRDEAGAAVSSGIYFLKASALGQSATKKLVLAK